MKVQIIKPHHAYSGIVDLPTEAANYLLRCGVAIKAKEGKAKVKKQKS